MKITFLPQNISTEITSGKSVMDIAREKKLPVSSSCNGMCTCAECRIYVVKGEAHILPPSTKEMELIGGGYYIDNRRLACQLFCFGDVTVDLSEQVERAKQKTGITKQFLKRLQKTNPQESSSVSGILIEQDQAIKNIKPSEVEHFEKKFQDLDPFYQVKKENFFQQKRSSDQEKKSSNFRDEQWKSRNKKRRNNRKRKNKKY